MSKIEVDAIDKQSGSTLTLGGSGTAVTLASGATQTGFGREGSVNWQTSIKTSTFTAVSGEGYFVDTSSGAVTANLPAGTAGSIVAFSDYARNFETNNLTVSPNGSQKIGGIAATSKLNVNGQASTFVYADDTKGWVNVQNAEDTEIGTSFIEATGGTITNSGNCRIHTFTGPGTFCVSSISSSCAANNVVSYVVVAGGGSSGGGETAGGGGAGGYREAKSPATPYTASPLDGYPSAPNRVTVTATAFPITVGAGGAAPSASPAYVRGNNGSNSIFSTITSAGGGGGGARLSPLPANAPGAAGGSGGGGTGLSAAAGAGGAGNTPPTSPAQGTAGGTGACSPGNAQGSGGGGGATSAGGNHQNPGGGPGGNGATSSITGSPVTRAGGGGGGLFGPGPVGAAGPGGGGVGGRASPNSDGAAGTANTGGGGGSEGGPGSAHGNAGGSGIVIIRYRFQ